MILYMLDTDICSYIIKERPLQVLEHFKQVEMEQLCISAVTYAELIYGVEHSSSKKVNRVVIEDFVLHLTIVPWGEEAAEHYGSIRAYLQAEGKIIGSMDMMIAAHARSQKMTLVTNNDKHFKRVPKLTVENWAK
jgi:tRNA(fMet)-specific endonuclease VapC